MEKINIEDLDNLCRAGAIIKELIKKAENFGFESEEYSRFFYVFIKYYTEH